MCRLPSGGLPTSTRRLVAMQALVCTSVLAVVEQGALLQPSSRDSTYVFHQSGMYPEARTDHVAQSSQSQPTHPTLPRTCRASDAFVSAGVFHQSSARR